jgi:hypothetical protein
MLHMLRIGFRDSGTDMVVAALALGLVGVDVIVK